MASVREKREKRLEGLKQVRNPFEREWREVSKYTQPARSRFQTSDKDRNSRQWNDRTMRDETGLLAFRITAGGMNSGLTSSSRPWFKLAFHNDELMDDSANTEWLAAVEKSMYAFIAQTNFYGAMRSLFSELPLFGTGAVFMQAHDRVGMVSHALTVGEYWIGMSDAMEVDSLYRQVPLSVKQAVDSFGKSVSQQVMNKYDRSDYDSTVNAFHSTEPNPDYEEGVLGSFPYSSVYWDQDDSNKTRTLSEGGYEEKPFMAPRWDLVGSDTYGFSPGMECLPSLRELQLLTLRRNRSVDFLNNPEKVVPPNVKLTGQAGSVVSASGVDAQGVLVPYKMPYQAVEVIYEQISRTKEMISEISFANLFNAITNMPGVQPRTVEEIQARNEEKFTQIGQVVDRVNNEALEVAIDRVFGIMQRGGLLPAPPEDLEDADLKIGFQSILTQMQRAVGLAQSERTTAFIGGLSGTFPEAGDKLNVDELIDDYAERAGTSPNVINGDDEVEAIRQARAKKQQQKEMLEAAPAIKTGVEGAQLLAEVQQDGAPV